MPRLAERPHPPMRTWSFLAVLLCAVLSGCDRDAHVGPAALREAKAPGAAPAPAATRERAEIRKLVKTVELDLRVPDTTASAGALQTLTTGLGGYVGEMNAQREGNLLYYRLTLRVPVDRLDDAVAKIKGLAERIDREVVRTEDVTEQHIDLSARLRTLEATETELRGLLSESRRSGRKADEIMAIYEKLMEIRSSTEQIQGQLQALEKMTALSTINVQLWPTESAVPVVSEGWHPGQTARRAFRGLLASLRVLGDFVIIAVIVLLPIGLVLAIPAWGLVRLWRNVVRRRKPGGA